MEKLKIEKHCYDKWSFNGKVLDDEWLERNNLLEISFDKDKNLIILINNDGTKIKYNENDFEYYLTNHK